MRNCSKNVRALALLAGCAGAIACGGAAGASSKPTSSGPPRSGCAEVKLQDGLDLVILGSGGPRSAGRAASSYVLAIGGTPLVMVDVGSGAFTRLGESGLDTAALDTVLLTHLHIDHVGDLADFVKSRDLGEDGPIALRIYGPSARDPYQSTTGLVSRLFGEQGAFAYLPAFRNELTLYALHTPPRRIGEVAAAAGVHTLILSHLPPGIDASKDDVLASVRASFQGEVRFAHDCMHVALGAEPQAAQASSASLSY